MAASLSALAEMLSKSSFPCMTSVPGEEDDEVVDREVLEQVRTFEMCCVLA